MFRGSNNCKRCIPTNFRSRISQEDKGRHKSSKPRRRVNYARTLRKKMKKPKAKNKKLAGMYGNKSKITRGDIIAAAKKRKKNRRNGR